VRKREREGEFIGIVHAKGGGRDEKRAPLSGGVALPPPSLRGEDIRGLFIVRAIARLVLQGVT